MVELSHTPRVNEDGDKQFAVVPAGMQVHDLSKFFPPKVTVASVVAETGAAFVAYLNRFKTENTMLFAQVTDSGATIKAFIDYHGVQDAARCQHTVEFNTTPTKEWTTWMESDRHPMNQVDFATWLEDNQSLFNNPDAKPTGAELLELVLSLEGKQHVSFKSAHRLDSGKNRLDYDEEVVLKGQTSPSMKEGGVDLPKELIAGISPFQGAIPYAVKARLKYRIQSRALALWYETIAPHVIIRDSVKSVLKEIEDGTAIKPIQGRKAGS